MKRTMKHEGYLLHKVRGTWKGGEKVWAFVVSQKRQGLFRFYRAQEVELWFE